MRRLFFAAALAFAVPLASCATVPSSPSAVAGSSVIDEKAAIGVETAYTAASRAAALAIKTGIVKDKATIDRIGALDNKAYAAVQATRAAYSAGNAGSYDSAFTQAEAAVKALLSAF